MAGLDYPTVEELPGRFAIAKPRAHGQLGDLIQVLTGFRRHAELPGAQSRFHILRSVAYQGDFKIVDERGSIHGDARNEAPPHQIDEQRAESDFDDVAADAPQNSPVLLARSMDGAKETAQVSGSQNIGKRIEKFQERKMRSRWLRKIVHADFALPRRKRIRVQVGEGDGPAGVDTH